MQLPFHTVAKPAGALCNMSCSYCFYSEKKSLFPCVTRMTDELLERFIRSYIEAQPGTEVSFLWQGGEPLLMGIDFYRKAVRLQNRYRGVKRISNSIQTNGTLLNEEWCRFLKANRFLVGISLDGPPEIHDAYRLMRSGKPSFPEVLRGVRLLQQFGADYNITCCVSDVSARDPLAVYHFFKEIGVEYLQFAPIVERLPSDGERAAGLLHASPDTGTLPMAPGSVGSEDYGRFLSAVFDEWVRNDIGHLYVMNFEWALSAWAGLPVSYCLFSEQCGNALALEHNGDCYSCDHYVYPEYYLGNLRDSSFPGMLSSAVQQTFRGKKTNLPENCKCCPYLFACHGECPKNRFLPGGGNYLCDGYRLYFAHIKPYMDEMIRLLRSGHQAYEIRRTLRESIQ